MECLAQDLEQDLEQLSGTSGCWYERILPTLLQKKKWKKITGAKLNIIIFYFQGKLNHLSHLREKNSLKGNTNWSHKTGI